SISKSTKQSTKRKFDPETEKDNYIYVDEEPNTPVKKLKGSIKPNKTKKFNLEDNKQSNGQSTDRGRKLTKVTKPVSQNQIHNIGTPENKRRRYNHTPDQKRKSYQSDQFHTPQTMTVNNDQENMIARDTTNQVSINGHRTTYNDIRNRSLPNQPRRSDDTIESIPYGTDLFKEEGIVATPIKAEYIKEQAIEGVDNPDNHGMSALMPMSDKYGVQLLVYRKIQTNISKTSAGLTDIGE
ncbi:hypothetical protein SNEBB_002847, partial [Seison nebaliae]